MNRYFSQSKVTKMKIVVFKGGIGNQLFQYNMIKYLEQKGHRVYYKDETNRYFVHYGLEVDKYFDVNLHKLPKMLDIIYDYMQNQHFRKLFHYLSTEDNVYDESKIRFDGYWANLKYMIAKVKFKELPLNYQNQQVLEDIQKTNSVSIHIRRGDYLTVENQKIFGGICTLDYYQKAIQKIRELVDNPSFFIFSDDIEWCKENFDLPNSTFIDWNTGVNSIYDMYLMSYCKTNIIANSTFSYWGGRIYNGGIVIYPKKWFNEGSAPNIFPEEWIGL